MTERTLPFNRSIVAQETGYWCGPASTQIALSVRGISVPEAQLARELHTTEDGTNSVSNVEPALDSRLPGARYTPVYRTKIPADQRKARFWWDIVRSVDNGYAVVINLVVPPGKGPRGVKGSGTPGYSTRITTWHYVTVVGWSDEGNGGRTSVLVADPGFAPNVYWVDFEQLFGLIFYDDWKGYLVADLPLIAAPGPGVKLPDGIPLPVSAPPPPPPVVAPPSPIVVPPSSIKLGLADPFTGAIWSPSRYSPRRVPGIPGWIALHTQEGGRTARDLALFLANAANEVSYHSVNDDIDVLKVVAEGDAPWAASNANDYAFHHCFAGSYASWSRDRWLSPDTSDGKNEDLQLTKGAHVVAWWCDKYGVPAQWIGGGAQPPWGLRGILGHQDLGIWGGGHHDPGGNFPINEFLRRVKELLTGVAQPPLPVLPPVIAPGTNPDKYGDWLLSRDNPKNDPDRVMRVQHKLKVAYQAYAGHLAVDGIFGQQTQAAVREFQRRVRPIPLVADGIVGPATAAALQP